MEKFIAANRGGMANDRDGAPVFLAKSQWELGYVADRHPAIKFAKTRERSDVHAEQS
jgi:peptide chain release factor 3